MISKFQSLLELFGPKNSSSEESRSSDLETATCVLFLELAYADFNVADEESEHIYKSMASFFSLATEEVKELIKIAKDKREHRTDIWIFTNRIKNNFSKADKIKILEMLWGLVYADGHMDKYEEALMRKITTLLGLSHGEMITAKLKAKK